MAATMSLRARKPLIFTFVLGALALGAAMVYFFGGRELVSRHESFLLYFKDSVNGLVPGSLVKFKGVPVGYVEAIRLDYRQPGRHDIPVLIQLNADRLHRRLGVMEDLADPAVLAAQLRRGLRAEMDADSYVSGQMFIELEYYSPPPPFTPVTSPPGKPPLAVIPVLSSGAIADLQKVQDFATWLPNFDFRDEFEKFGGKVDAITTTVAVIPYAEYSLRVQRTLGPLDRLNFDRWDRGFNNFLARLTRYQDALESANDLFYAQSQDFAGMNHQTRDQFQQFDNLLAALRDSLHPDDPALAHLAHNLDQLSQDMARLAGKLNAQEQQPRLFDKLAH